MEVIIPAKKTHATGSGTGLHIITNTAITINAVSIMPNPIFVALLNSLISYSPFRLFHAKRIAFKP